MEDNHLGKVTLSDVAHLAQLSEATVSRVLNNNASVSAANRDAVLAAAEQLGYIHVPRKKIANKPIQSIAVCKDVDRLDRTQRRFLPGEFFGPVIDGIQIECQAQGINLLLMSIGADQEDLHEVHNAADRGLVDGLLFVHALDSGIIETLLELGLPAVLLGSYFPWLPIPSVNSDSFRGMLLAMRYLLDNGHRHIVYIDGYGPKEQDYWVRIRRVAYQHMLAEAGIPYDPDLVVYGYLSRSGGKQAMQSLLQSGKSFSAVLGANDESTFGAMQALQTAGIRIPDEVSVIGHDDVSAATLVTPPLTTVQVLKHDMGRIAVQLLLEQARQSQQPPQHILTTESLIPRASVRNLAGDSLCPVNPRIMP